MTTTYLIIRDQFGKIFNISLITPHYVFFTDDSDGIMMFYVNEPERKPLRAYGAEELLIEVILKNEWIWASNDMKYNIKCILEEYDTEDY